MAKMEDRLLGIAIAFALGISIPVVIFLAALIWKMTPVVIRYFYVWWVFLFPALAKKPNYLPGQEVLELYLPQHLTGKEVLKLLYWEKFRRTDSPAARTWWGRQILKLYKEVSGGRPGMEKLFYYVLRPIMIKYWARWGALLNLQEAGLSSVLQAVHHYWPDRRSNAPLWYWNPKLPLFFKSTEYLDNFVKYLFATYPVEAYPRSIWRNWEKWPPGVPAGSNGIEEQQRIPQEAFFQLYFHLAKGRKLCQADFLPFQFSEQAAGWYQKAPESLPPVQAFWWATFAGLGGNPFDWERIDWLNPGLDLPAFWKKMLGKIVRQPENDSLYLAFEVTWLLKFGIGTFPQDFGSNPKALTEPAEQFSADQALDLLYKERFQWENSPAARSAEGRKIFQWYRKVTEGQEGMQKLFYCFLRPTIALGIFSEKHLDKLKKAGWPSVMKAAHFWYRRKAKRSGRFWEPSLKLRSNPDQYLDDFIFHLFAHYSVGPYPRSIWRNWENWEARVTYGRETAEQIRKRLSKLGAFFQLYFHLADGISMRQANFMPFRLSKRAAGFYQRAPEKLHPQQAYWWATYMAFGGHRLGWSAIAPLRLDLDRQDFWKQFLMLAARQPDYPHTGHVYDIIKLIKFGEGSMAKYPAYQPLAKSLPGLMLKGLSLQTLSARFIRMTGTASIRYTLPRSLKVVYAYGKPEKASYRIVWLDSYQALAKESEELSHCLGNLSSKYPLRALKGDYSYWSLRLQAAGGREKRLATIELYGRSITAVNGPYNAAPEAAQLAVINKWARQLRLRLSAEKHPALLKS